MVVANLWKIDKACRAPEVLSLSLTLKLSIQKCDSKALPFKRHRRVIGSLTLSLVKAHLRHSGVEYHNRLRARDNE